MKAGLSAGVALLLLGCGTVPDWPGAFDMDLFDKNFHPRVATNDHTAWVEEAARKEELTLQEALRLADILNPELNALRKDIEIAAADVLQASLYPNPNLVFEVQGLKTSGSASLRDAERVGGIEFPVVWGGRIGAATTLAQKRREQVAFSYLWIARQKLSEVKKAFIEVVALQSYEALTQGTREVAGKVHELTDTRFKAQAIAEVEVLKSSVSLAKVEADLRTVQGQSANAVKNLKTLLGDPGLPTQKFVGTLHSEFETPSFEALKGQILLNHPALEAAKRSKEAAEAELELARAERWPDLGFQILAGRGEENDSILEAGISIPLPMFDRNQGKIAAAGHKIQRAEFEQQAARNSILQGLSNAYTTFVSAQDRAKIYRDDILPKAQKALDQSDMGYRQGKFSYLDLLDAQRTIAEAQISYVFALLDLNQSAAELELVTGSEIKGLR